MPELDGKPAITPMLFLDEADSLVRAWNGDPSAISSPLTAKAIEIIADALDSHEASVPTNQEGDR